MKSTPLKIWAEKTGAGKAVERLYSFIPASVATISKQEVPVSIELYQPKSSGNLLNDSMKRHFQKFREGRQSRTNITDNNIRSVQHNKFLKILTVNEIANEVGIG